VSESCSKCVNSQSFPVAYITILGLESSPFIGFFLGQNAVIRQMWSAIAQRQVPAKRPRSGKEPWMKFWASTNHNGWLRGLFRGSSEDVPQRYNMICGVAGVSWPLAGVVCSSSVVLCVFVCVVWGCFGLAGFLASVPPLSCGENFTGQRHIWRSKTTEVSDFEFPFSQNWGAVELFRHLRLYSLQENVLWHQCVGTKATDGWWFINTAFKACWTGI
jgi:hypothetical protein